jgi:hypothetical protein
VIPLLRVLEKQNRNTTMRTRIRTRTRMTRMEARTHVMRRGATGEGCRLPRGVSRGDTRLLEAIHQTAVLDDDRETSAGAGIRDSKKEDMA